MSAIVIPTRPSLWRLAKRWLTERNLFIQIRAAEFEIKHDQADIEKLRAGLEAKKAHLVELTKAVQRNRLS